MMERMTLKADERNRFSTPDRRRDSMTRSQFLSNSVNRNSVNPEDVIQSFFKRDPFEKYKEDLTRYRPVSYDSPNKSVAERNYVIVDEKVSYGKPMSMQQFELLRSKQKKVRPEVVTYGVEERKDRARQLIEVKKETSKANCGCCGYEKPQKNNVYVSNYK